MVGIVIVSHSSKISEGIRELTAQMAKPEQKIVTAGGTKDGEIGTDAVKIYQSILDADTGDGVVIMVDLGSAVLNAETALELLDDRNRERVRIADAPIVEGAVSAVVQASLGASLTEVISAAQEARTFSKC
jgi:phosphoenolpyruvate---glycerone phosphotransferase subunit DhaM